MEFSICWLTPNIWKIYRYFLLSKNDFWLILRLFIFSPLKYQKYLENFHNWAKRVVVEGGRGHKGYFQKKNTIFVDIGQNGWEGHCPEPKYWKFSSNYCFYSSEQVKQS